VPPLQPIRFDRRGTDPDCGLEMDLLWRLLDGLLEGERGLGVVGRALGNWFGGA
jgi:hypothetical protein